MLNPTFGVANVFARWLPWVTDNPQWLNSEKLALACVIVITVWKGFPFYALVILAALQTVPGSLYEAARVDGASPWGRFRYVTLPAILPTLSLLVDPLLDLRDPAVHADLPDDRRRAGTATSTLAIDIYQQAFRFYDFTYASTVAVAGVVTSALAVVLFIVIEKRARRRRARMSAAASDAPGPVRPHHKVPPRPLLPRRADLLPRRYRRRRHHLLPDLLDVRELDPAAELRAPLPPAALPARRSTSTPTRPVERPAGRHLDPQLDEARAHEPP